MDVMNLMWKPIIGLTILLLGLALVGPVSALTIDSVKPCDKKGNYKEIFLTNEIVYVEIKTSGSGSKTVHIYVVENKNWRKGDKLEDVSGGYEEFMSNAPGSYIVTVWKGNLKVGEYDIIVDEDLDGEYDPGEKGHILGVVAGFFVIPEFPLGSLMAIIIYFGALAGLATKRLRFKH